MERKRNALKSIIIFKWWLKRVIKAILIIGQRVYNVSCFLPNGKRARKSTRSEDSWTSAETTARA